MRYNLSRIMKRAWEIVKKEGKTISAGLKRAWEEAKKEIKTMALKGSEKQIKWAEDILATAKRTVEVRVDFYSKKLDSAVEGYDDIVGFQIGLRVSEKIKKQLEKAIEPFETAAQVIDRRKFLSSDYINKAIDDIIYQERWLKRNKK